MRWPPTWHWLEQAVSQSTHAKTSDQRPPGVGKFNSICFSFNVVQNIPVNKWLRKHYFYWQLVFSFPGNCWAGERGTCIKAELTKTNQKQCWGRCRKNIWRYMQEYMQIYAYICKDIWGYMRIYATPRLAMGNTGESHIAPLSHWEVTTGHLSSVINNISMLTTISEIMGSFLE